MIYQITQDEDVHNSNTIIPSSKYDSLENTGCLKRTPVFRKSQASKEIPRNQNGGKWIIILPHSLNPKPSEALPQILF